MKMILCKEIAWETTQVVEIPRDGEIIYFEFSDDGRPFLHYIFDPENQQIEKDLYVLEMAGAGGLIGRDNYRHIRSLTKGGQLLHIFARKIVNSI